MKNDNKYNIFKKIINKIHLFSSINYQNYKSQKNK